VGRCDGLAEWERWRQARRQAKLEAMVVAMHAVSMSDDEIRAELLRLQGEPAGEMERT